MNVTGLGIDIVEIARFRTAMERQGQALLDRCFLPSEQEYCGRHREPERHYAGRFAAKEAVAKAFGTGIGEGLGWHDIEITREENGAPRVVLHGPGAETARRLGIAAVLVSISHSEHYAVANALGITLGFSRMFMPFYQLVRILPTWLISVLGLVFLAWQIFLMVDCVRNQRDFYWLWILWVFPLLGGIVYWFYFRWNGSRVEFWLFRRSHQRRRLEELENAAENVGNAANFEELGDELWRQSKYAEAEANYRKALAKDAKLRDSRVRLGYCLSALGRPAEGWPFIASMMAENRQYDHEHLLWQAARCRRALQDLPGAKELYEEFLQRHSYFQPQVELAEVLIELGNTAEARRICEEVIKDLKTSPPYVRRRQGKFAGQARRLLRRVK